jgi:4-hydroxyphenylpyruvate dioxygenase
MGFVNFLSFDDKQITQYSALMSKVMSNGNGGLNFQSTNQPKERKNQIEEYLDFYGGPGIQHIAIATDDIIKTVSQLKQRRSFVCLHILMKQFQNDWVNI